MSVICGVDFSEGSLRIAGVAARLCANAGKPLHLVHVVEPSGARSEPVHGGAAWDGAARGRLAALAHQLAARGVHVEPHVEAGAPDHCLTELARHVDAELILVGAAAGGGDGPAVGGNAYRLAHAVEVPVLVVHAVEPFEAWSEGTRPLRILFGVDVSHSSEVATRWIAGLRAFGPIEVVAAHLYWPPEQFERLGLPGVRDYAVADPTVTATLKRDIAKRLEVAIGVPPVKTSVEPHMGRIGDRLATIAQAERADLVVVGSHARSRLGQWAHGSVSRDVIATGRVSVACVPEVDDSRLLGPLPIREALVATDFSPTGNSALPLARSVVGATGLVHLIHVLPSAEGSPLQPHDIFDATQSESPIHVEARRTLQRVAEGFGPAERTRIHLLASTDVARAIAQAAERLDVGLICLGTHGRGASRVLLGSVSSALLAATKRPVLLTHAPSP